MLRLRSVAVILLLVLAQEVYAQIDISPYYSIKSTKSITPGDKGKTLDNEKVKQREEYGIKASLKVWKILKLQLALGQSQLDQTETASEVKDEYDEIDFQSELEIDTSDPSAQVKISETQRIGKFSFIFDPSFSIFIARFKLGLTARQRIVKKSQSGQPDTQVEEGPTYKPHSGIGFGVRLSRRTFWMAEYEFYHYSYPPNLEPFERELSVSFGVSI